MRDGDVMAIHDIRRGTAGSPRLVEVRDDLMAMKIEVDPARRAATFGTAEHAGVEGTRGGEIVDGEREMERPQGQGVEAYIHSRRRAATIRTTAARTAFALRAIDRHAGLAAIALGGVSATGFAPLSLWPITLVALAAWLAMIDRAPGWRAACWRGWLFGVGHFTIGNNWIQHAFTFQDAMPHWLGYLAVVLLSLYLAVFPMLAAVFAWALAGAARRRSRAPDLGFALVFGAAWIATEWLRATLLTGYPWNPLGVVWLPLVGVARLASLVGTYALSGITITVAGSLLLLWARRWRPALIAAAAIAALTVAGVRHDIAARGQSAGDRAQTAHRRDVTAPRVRVVQPDLGEEERPTDDYAEHNLRALMARSGQPGGAPRLIFWPEGALRYFVDDGYPPFAYWHAQPATTRRRIAALLGRRDVVLTGGEGLRFDPRDDPVAGTNSVYALGSGGTILGRYDKSHLVPWGEYLPARAILGRIGLARLVPGDLDFLPGPGPRALEVPGFGLVGVQICYEIIFSGAVVDPHRRPRLIFNPSNDSWFGSWGPPQHLAQARLRAIEEGLPIVRATPTGISAIIAADGRIIAMLPAATGGAIEAALPPSLAPTLFARWGNLLAAATATLMLVLALGLAAAAYRSGRRAAVAA